MKSQFDPMSDPRAVAAVKRTAANPSLTRGEKFRRIGSRYHNFLEKLLDGNRRGQHLDTYA